ncbi:MAG: preprotein translocase subunit Sec61beta [Candidatus Bathyarchaeota archaeon]|nr:preprotein translocase subunit Sec61beta [Candidatus Bathyarchaeota archaeon]MCZ2845548.1 preprotein translocase subunit Sec61beta [Candidatus Bathyarchaeota archaeon]
MSKRGRREKQRRREAPMPAASAGLLRFFEEDTPGIRIRPEIVLIIGVTIIAISLIVNFSLK